MAIEVDCHVQTIQMRIATMVVSKLFKRNQFLENNGKKINIKY